MQLEQKLDRARLWERRTFWVVVVSLVLAFGLLPVSASKLFGPADPTETGANWLSVLIGVIQVGATIVFWLGLASYYSRFRPAVQRVSDQLRDQTMLEVLSELRDLRREVESLKSLPR